MKKFLILMSAGAAFALSSCATKTSSCCGTCKSKAEACCGKCKTKSCDADCKCSKCTAKKD